ncbi:T9SS type A sorting domain-containing protein [Flavobacterium sp.]|uniref:T9SS type A sorting domain-containing protein n=1 Tax=Flavobacterium sp. TaxID=239 RepID=UPI00286CDCA4|nr:T9SS type A sorting domain-containing protein [Flavobacterium sp.]
MRKIYTSLLLFSITVAFPQSGELDLNFGVSGFLITQNEDLDTGHSLTVMPNDQIVMVGGYDNFTAIKLMADGTYDNTFGTQGQLLVNFAGYNAAGKEVVVQPDGKIIIAGDVFTPGGIYFFGVVRLNPDGNLDNSFNGTGKLVFDFDEDMNYLSGVALQPDGKIVVTGQAGTYSSADYVAARINADGTLDNSFGINGKQRINVQGDDRGTCMALQPDGKILIGGFSYPVASSNCWFAAVRLTTDGQLDTTFSTDGKAVAKVASSYGNDTVYDMTLQPDGKILMAADSYIGASQDVGIVRFTTNGDLDNTFSGDGRFSINMVGTSDYCNAIVVQPDGNILVAGSYYTTPERNMFVIRLTPGGELDITFNSDGKANFVVPEDNGVSVYDMKLQSTGQILVSGYALNDFMIARIFSGTELSTQQWDINKVSFYPNPATNEIYFTENIATVCIYTLDGKKIAGQKNSSIKMDVSHLMKGIYLIDIETAEKTIVHQKLVKR